MLFSCLKNENKTLTKINQENECIIEFDHEINNFDKENEHINFLLELKTVNNPIEKKLNEEKPMNIEEMFQQRLFEKYRYRKFNSSIARVNLASSNKRPSTNDWDKFIDSLLSKSIISRVSYGSMGFRFNLKAKSKNSYFKYFLVINCFKRLINRNSGVAMTLSKLHSCFNSHRRPGVKDLKRTV